MRATWGTMGFMERDSFRRCGLGMERRMKAIPPLACLKPGSVGMEKLHQCFYATELGRNGKVFLSFRAKPKAESRNPFHSHFHSNPP